MILDSALELHCFSAAYVILCLSFCNMNFKSFDTSIKYHENLNRLIISLRRDSITPNLVKPDISEIRAEHKYVAEKKSVGGEEEAFLTQLGVHYFRDNKCSMRTQALKVSRDKKWSTFTNFSAFSEWLETGKTLTKRNLFQLLGQCYSQNLNVFHFFPQTILKFCCAKHTRENKNHEEWDGVVCSSLNVAVKAAVHMYFEECRLKQERNQISKD